MGCGEKVVVIVMIVWLVVAIAMTCWSPRSFCCRGMILGQEVDVLWGDVDVLGEDAKTATLYQHPQHCKDLLLILHNKLAEFDI